MKGLSIIWVTAELLVFVLVSETIGFVATIGLIVLSMLLGGAIMRWQGLENLNQIQARTARGEPPEITAIHTIAIVLGGILMVIPGLITSAIGILLLIPKVRNHIAGWIINHRVISPRMYRNKQGRVVDADNWEEKK